MPAAGPGGAAGANGEAGEGRPAGFAVRRGSARARRGRDVAAGQKPGDRRRVMATWRETPFSAASVGLRPRRRAGRRRRLGRVGDPCPETAIGILPGLAPGLDPFRGCRHAEQASRSREPTALHALGEQSVMAHAHEASRDDMVQEATAELDPGNGLGLPPATIPSVLVGEGDLAVAMLNEALVGDGDPVGVAAEVAQDLQGPAIGGLE